MGHISLFACHILLENEGTVFIYASVSSKTDTSTLLSQLIHEPGKLTAICEPDYETHDRLSQQLFLDNRLTEIDRHQCTFS